MFGLPVDRKDEKRRRKKGKTKAVYFIALLTEGLITFGVMVTEREPLLCSDIDFFVFGQRSRKCEDTQGTH